MEAKVQALSVTHIHIDRFCLSDDYFRFYTRFSSERVFRIFWESLEPSASNLVYWSKAQRQGLEAVSGSNPKRKLQLTDEVFSLLLLRVCRSKREGLGRSLQCEYNNNHQSYCIIAWANFLYLILGSLHIWMTKEQVRATMPAKFQKYCPDVCVILDCTEIRC